MYSIDNSLNSQIYYGTTHNHEPQALIKRFSKLHRYVRKKPPGFRIQPDTVFLWTACLLTIFCCCTPTATAHCNEQQFRCRDDSCIFRGKMCDGHPDCPDSSDEIDCDAGMCRKPHWFQCAGPNSACIAQHLVCNGHENCVGGEDERDCPYRRVSVSGRDPKMNSKRRQNCSEYEYTCQSTEKECIPLDFMCDGKSDCRDGSDEVAGCLQAQARCQGFFCSNKRCLSSAEWRCDGTNDCGDNSDEQNCTRNCTPALGSFLCHNNSTCLNLTQVCDGVPNCSDGSDESSRCTGTGGTSNCSTRVCPVMAKCQMLPDSGPECVCPKGYRYSSLQNACTDINECAETYGLCSQGCENTSGGYRCTCDESYKMLADNHTCEAYGGEALLLYTTQVTVMGVRLQSKLVYPVASNLTKVIGVTFDGDHIYWTNIQNDGESIVRSKADGTQQEVLLTAGLDAPEDLAIDWWTGNIYFSDNIMEHIAVCSNTGEYCTVLVTLNVHQPRGVALWPQRGQMFWTDWGLTPMIVRASMDGSNSLTLVKENIHWPNGIALDLHGGRVYWVDAKLGTMESIHPDGTGRRLVLSGILKHPYGLDVFEDRLYWSDWGTKSVHSCLKYTGKDHRIITKDRTIYALHVYHPAKQSRSEHHACATSRCSHLCLLAESGGYTCACPDGMQLGPDNLRCVKTQKRQRLFIAMHNTILEIEHTHFGRHVVSQSHPLPILISEMAYNTVNASIFLADNLQRAIFEYHPSTMKLEKIVDKNLGNISAMAFDYMAHVLYWTDIDRHVIEVLSLRTHHRAIISFFSGVEVPIGLTIVPEDGVLFVALRSRRHMHIDQLPLNGRAGEHAHIFEDDLGEDDIKFAVDYRAQTLYWSDSDRGRITYTNYRKIHADTFRSRLRRPYGLAIVDDDIFWSELNSPAIHWMHKSNLGPMKRLDVEIASGSYANHMPQRLPILASHLPSLIDHPCQMADNGGCSHVCVISTRTSGTCLCPAGLVFRDTLNQTCIETLDCEFRCRSGECLTLSRRCNGRKDCPDASDEEGCQQDSAKRKKVTCTLGQFTCHNGEQCVSNEKRCDKRKDCRDNSDEAHCEHFDQTKKCHRHQHECSNSRCVDLSRICDGVDDCGDNSDEIGCQDQTTGDGKAGISRPRCELGMFQCNSGSCIARSWECDGKLDCTDGSDEHDKCSLKDCEANMHKCIAGQCLDARLVCNGHNDCGDMTDELNCNSTITNSTCELGTFKCPSAKSGCLPMTAKCNGTAECPRGEDEADCDGMCGIHEFQCHTSKECIRLEFRCDKDNDCKDGSDELNCESRMAGGNSSIVISHERPCEADMFNCRDGRCVDMTRVCNGFKDCDSGIDEGALCKTACHGANERGICSQKCRATPTGAICSCFTGYRLDADRRTCVDINECHDTAKESDSPCAQLCENTLGSYRCSCYPDFMLRPDKTSCKSIESEFALVFATHDEVRSMTELPITMHVLWSANDSKIIGFDIDVRRRLAYFTADGEDVLYKVNLTSKTILSALSVTMPSKVAVDWITGNIFVISRTLQRYEIRVCSFDAQMCGLIVQANPHEIIRNIAVDAYNRRLFYATIQTQAFGGPHSTITIADIDGHKHELLVSKFDGYISTIATDPHKKLLYYIDIHAHTLLAASYKTGDSIRRPLPILQKSGALMHPSGLVVYENEAFIVNIGSREVIRCALYGAHNCHTVNLNILNAEDVIVDGASRQPMGINSCEHSKCHGMCILAEYSYECMCGDKIISEQSPCQSSSHNAIVNNAALLSSKQNDNDDNDDEYSNSTVIFTIVMMIALIMAIAGIALVYYGRLKRGHRQFNITHHFHNPLSFLSAKQRSGPLNSDRHSNGSTATTASFEAEYPSFNRLLLANRSESAQMGTDNICLDQSRFSTNSVHIIEPQISNFDVEDTDDDMEADGTFNSDMRAHLVP